MRLEVRLQALFLARGDVEEGVGVRLVGEATRDDVDVEVHLLLRPEPQRGRPALHGVVSGKRLLDVVEDVLERITRGVIPVLEVADDVEIVRLEDHRSLGLRSTVANRQLGVGKLVPQQLLDCIAVLAQRIQLGRALLHRLRLQDGLQILRCSHGRPSSAPG